MRRSLPSAGVVNTLSFVRDAILRSSGYGGGNMQSWKDMLRLTHSLGLTLLGAGTVGALLLLRQLSPSSALSWILQARLPHSSPDDCSAFDPSQLSVPGLRNSGNNCFLNAILQALASSGVVLSFLAAYDRESILCLFGGVESRCISLPLTEALSDLLAELSELDPEPRIASPRHVMRALEPYAKQFDLSLQQDAAEALDYLADALQEERLAFFESFRAFRDSISDASRSLNGMVIEDASDKESSPLNSWKRWPLEGTMGSMLMCQECGFKFSTQFQSFHEVPLSPLRSSDGNIVTGCNLEACLEQYTAPERIMNVMCSCCSHSLALHLLQSRDGLDKAMLQRIKDCCFEDDCLCEQLVTQMGGLWRNVYVKATKQLRFGRCPEVMCCQVQRVVVSTSGELVKWTGHVSFPLVLNLQPYVMSSQDYSGKPLGQWKGSSQVLHEVLWSRRTLETQSNFEFLKTMVPSSTDASSSDDTHTSGSEDLASDTSSESTAGRSGDEFVEKHRDASDDISQWDRCNNSIGSRDLKMYGLDSVFFPKFGQSHIPPDDKDPLLLRFRELGDGFKSCPQGVQMHNLFVNIPIPSTAIPSALAYNKNRDCEVQQDGPCFSRRWLYELISVVVHHGSSNGGHYTVYRKAKLKQSDFMEREESHVDVSSAHDCKPMDTGDCDALEIGDCMMHGEQDEERADKIESRDLCAENASEKRSSVLEEGDAGNAIEDLNVTQVSSDDIVLWFRVSDSHVTLVTEEEVLMAQATLLFYERSVAEEVLP